MNIKRRTYEILEGNWENSGLALGINVFMVALIAFNIIMVVLESVDSIHAQWGDVFSYLEWFSVVIFSIEYIARVWSCTTDPSGRYAHPLVGRLRFIVSPMATIDLLAILPTLIAHLTGADLRFLRIFRLLRMLKLTRYFPALHFLASGLYNQRRALASASFIMVMMLVLASSLMHMVEKEAQPEAFGSIPAAMWWGMATLTTVGYGDVIPTTVAGKILGTIIAIIGIGMFALPAAILASGFSQEMERRDFVVSWNMVASMPLFERLTALQISEITDLLTFQSAIPGEYIFRKDDPADAMYFITQGEILIYLEGTEPIELRPGDFFGEMGLIAHRTRTAHARSDRSSRLLVLSQLDFEDLCERNPKIHEQLVGVAEEREQAIVSEGE